MNKSMSKIYSMTLNDDGSEDNTDLRFSDYATVIILKSKYRTLDIQMKH